MKNTENNIMREYCGICDKINEVSIKNINETYSVKSEETIINVDVVFCNICGNKVHSPALDEQVLKKAFLVYRKKHNLLTPDQIIQIRTKYLLTQRSLAKLLEWGEITIHRYESGAIQDPAHNEVLVLINNSNNMREIFTRNKHLLSGAVSKRLEKKLEELLNAEIAPQPKTVILEEYLGHQRIDEYSGFRKFSLEKVSNMILYIAEKTGGAFTTKLNKLLWCADFLHCKKFSLSISGSSYVHLPLGPVPNDYKWIIADVMDDGLIGEEEVIYSNGTGGSEYKALATTDLSLFTKDELRALAYVIEYFKSFNCDDIKEYSHKEKGYEETDPSQAISYKYAKELTISLP